jgi:acyl-CoA thioesterase FadM
MAQPIPVEPSAAVVTDEPVVATAPLVVRRIVKFGETDAAGVVYTGRFLDYALEAFEVWFRHVIGLSWAQQMELQVGTPAVSCHLDFSLPLRAGDRLDIEVRLDRIGGKSFTVRTVGRDRDGQDVFVGSMTFATIDIRDRSPISIPDPYREKMNAYVAACERDEGV